MDMEKRGLQRAAHLARHITRSEGNSKYENLHRIESIDPVDWRPWAVGDANEFEEILYEKGEGIAKVTINRPEQRNAFTAKTVEELQLAFTDARDDTEIGVVILTGKGDTAFCSGGFLGARSNLGHHVGEEQREVPNLTIMDLQMQIRRLSKPVIAMVAGYAVGAGNILQLVCDLTIAADNAVFGCTQPKLGSFDAGFGVSTMAHIIGARKTKEVWFLARFYDAQEALSMGLVNTVVPLDKLEQETVKWCREILSNSPTAIRVLRVAINATEGSSDQQALTSNLSMYFYASDEAEEGRRAFLERRRPNFSKFK